MGMYTEIIFGANVVSTIPPIDKQALDYLFTDDTQVPLSLPNHPFFECDRWKWLTTCSSYYFAVRNTHRSIVWDEISNTWNLSFRANLKNYNQEIEKFLDWIKPYIEKGSGTRDFYAIVCYEEQAEPTIYYLKDN